MTPLVEDFYSAVRWHVPVIHLPTFSLDGKPPVLLHGISLCGAYLSKSVTAQSFARVNWESSILSLLEACVRDLHYPLE